MKALTLHQPWAALVAFGEKGIETRSWPTKYRGPLAIHAGLNRRYLDFCAEQPFKSALLRHHVRGPADLQFGRVIAIAHLVACRPTEGTEEDISEREFQFGDYSRGRFCWIFSAVAEIDPPVVAKGWQGLWNWDETRARS